MNSEKTWALKGPRATQPGWPRELAELSQYEVLRELGRGGMGVVFLAKNRLLDRLEVLKVVRHGWLSSPGALARFQREIQSAAKLRHEHVVGAYNAIQVGELFGFAMEYVDGQDLYRLVQSQGTLAPGLACEYVRQTALGLQHAFEKGMVHRDIKPQNLILAREGNREVVKILDFGLAKATGDPKFDSGLTDEGSLLGTPDYVAPEQILDAAAVDIRSDLYSLGCTLVFLLTGRPPFQANNVYELLEAHQFQAPTPLDQLRPDLPAGLSNLVLRLLAKDPSQRFQRPSEVANALGELRDANWAGDRTQVHSLAGLAEPRPISASSGSNTLIVLEERKGGSRRSVWGYAGAAVVLAGLGLGLATFVLKPDDKIEAKTPEIAQVSPNVVAEVPPPPPPKPSMPAGVLVLDDCDPESSGKPRYKDGLTFFDAGGERRFRLADFNESQTIGSFHRIAVDTVRRSIWVVEDVGGRIRRLDFAGQPNLTIDHPAGSALAVDPATGNIWVVGTGNGRGPGATVVYDPAGQTVARYPFGGFDIVHDPKIQSFWIVHHSLTKVQANTGEVTFSQAVPGFCISSVDADPGEGGVWLCVRGAGVVPKGNRLHRFNIHGDECLGIDLGERNPFSVSADGRGGVWVAFLRQSVQHFSAKGESLGLFELPAISVLAGEDGGIWVTTSTDLRKLSASGDQLLRRNFTGHTWQAWLAPLPSP